MTDLARLLTEAQADLTWLCTVPHTIDHIVRLAVENEGRRRVEEAQGRGGDGLGVSTSGHSDPTGDTAMKLLGQGHAVNATASIDAAIALVGEASVELERLVAVALGSTAPSPPHPIGRIGKLNHVVATCIVTGPLVDQARYALTGEDRTHLEHLVRDQITETAAWLRHKADTVINRTPEQDRAEPVQRTITECRICSPWRKGTIAKTTGICQECIDFRRNHKADPTEPIVRRWEIGKQATPGMILDAKAPKRKGRKTA